MQDRLPRWNPHINPVGIHPQLSDNKLPMDGVLLAGSSLIVQFVFMTLVPQREARHHSHACTGKGLKESITFREWWSWQLWSLCCPWLINITHKIILYIILAQINFHRQQDPGGLPFPRFSFSWSLWNVAQALVWGNNTTTIHTPRSAAWRWVFSNSLSHHLQYPSPIFLTFDSVPVHQR